MVVKLLQVRLVAGSLVDHYSSVDRVYAASDAERAVLEAEEGSSCRNS